MEGIVLQDASTDDRLTSERVISAVADATGKDPLDVEPLYSTIDPDALDALFTDRLSGDARAKGKIIFTLDGCTVIVSSDGRVTVDQSSTGERSPSGRGRAGPATVD